MDISYAVKQLDREIEVAEAQLREKKTARNKLYAALTPQEQVLFNPPAAADTAATTAAADSSAGASAKADPLDHDGDGKKGGSLPKKKPEPATP